MTKALDIKDKPKNAFISQKEKKVKLPEQDVTNMIDEVSLEVDQEDQGLTAPKVDTESVPDPEQGFIKKFASK